MLHQYETVLTLALQLLKWSYLIIEMIKISPSRLLGLGTTSWTAGWIPATTPSFTGFMDNIRISFGLCYKLCFCFSFPLFCAQGHNKSEALDLSQLLRCDFNYLHQCKVYLTLQVSHFSTKNPLWYKKRANSGAVENIFTKVLHLLLKCGKYLNCVSIPFVHIV